MPQTWDERQAGEVAMSAIPCFNLVSSTMLVVVAFCSNFDSCFFFCLNANSKLDMRYIVEMVSTLFRSLFSRALFPSSFQFCFLSVHLCAFCNKPQFIRHTKKITRKNYFKRFFADDRFHSAIATAATAITIIVIVLDIGIVLTHFESNTRSNNESQSKLKT